MIAEKNYTERPSTLRVILAVIRGSITPKRKQQEEESRAAHPTSWGRE